MENLTFEAFLGMVAQFRKPRLYYATSQFLSKGEVIRVEKGDFHPEYMACHPDDFEFLRRELQIHRILVPLADYQPTEEDLQAAGEAAAETIRDELIKALMGDLAEDE